MESKNDERYLLRYMPIFIALHRNTFYCFPSSCSNVLFQNAMSFPCFFYFLIFIVQNDEQKSIDVFLET